MIDLKLVVLIRYIVYSPNTKGPNTIAIRVIWNITDSNRFILRRFTSVFIYQSFVNTSTGTLIVLQYLCRLLILCLDSIKSILITCLHLFKYSLIGLGRHLCSRGVYPYPSLSIVYCAFFSSRGSNGPNTCLSICDYPRISAAFSFVYLYFKLIHVNPFVMPISRL